MSWWLKKEEGEEGATISASMRPSKTHILLHTELTCIQGVYNGDTEPQFAILQGGGGRRGGERLVRLRHSTAKSTELCMYTDTRILPHTSV